MTKRLAVLTLLVAAALGASLYLWRAANATEDASQMSEVTLPTPRVVRGLGYVEPVTEVRRLVFKIDGVIETVAVQLGQRVRAGELLVALRNTDEQAEVAAAEQALALAVAEREQLLAGIHPDQILATHRRIDVLSEQLSYAEKQHKRIASLAAKNVTTTEEVDRSDTNLRQAQKALQQAEAELANLENHVRDEDRQVAEAKVRVTEARLEVARQRLEHTLMKAPFDGTVLEILKREGEGARVLDREPVLIFADDLRLRVRAEIDERYVHELQPGQMAEVYGRGLGDQRFKATIGVVKRLMGNKTVFSREASERKDLDVLQVLIDMPSDFRAPLGLQVDVDVWIHGAVSESTRAELAEAQR